jgi:hypothetical protein
MVVLVLFYRLCLWQRRCYAIVCLCAYFCVRVCVCERVCECPARNHTVYCQFIASVSHRGPVETRKNGKSEKILNHRVPDPEHHVQQTNAKMQTR